MYSSMDERTPTGEDEEVKEKKKRKREDGGRNGGGREKKKSSLSPHFRLQLRDRKYKAKGNCTGAGTSS